MEVKSLGANLVMEFSTLMCDLKMSFGKCLEGANSKGITLGKKVGRQQDQDEQLSSTYRRNPLLILSFFSLGCFNQ